MRLRANEKFNLHGRRYRLGTGGVRSISILETIAKRGDGSLLSKRNLIREIGQLDRKALLSYVIQISDDHDIVRIAIWLRGRLRGSLGARVIAPFASDPDDATRKEAVRALRRMSCWHVLSSVLLTERNEKIRRIAECHPKPTHTRFAGFFRHVPGKRVIAVRRPFFLRAGVDIHGGRLPKTAERIRQVLERIRQLVGTRP